MKVLNGGYWYDKNLKHIIEVEVTDVEEQLFRDTYGLKIADYIRITLSDRLKYDSERLISGRV